MIQSTRLQFDFIAPDRRQRGTPPGCSAPIISRASFEPTNIVPRMSPYDDGGGGGATAAGADCGVASAGGLLESETIIVMATFCPAAPGAFSAA